MVCDVTPVSRAGGCTVAVVIAALGCGVRAPRSGNAMKLEPARVVVQTPVNPDTYVVQTPSARFAVFAQVVVDLSQRRVSRTDLDGVLGVPALDDQVYRVREDRSLELLDLRTGNVGAVDHDRAQEILRQAPEQSWSSHAGSIHNEALPQLSSETRAIATSLRTVEPAIVLDVDSHAARILTATSERVCLWSMRSLAREQCVPRAYQNYGFDSNAGFLVWQVLANGNEQVGTLSALNARVAWDTAGAVERLRARSLEQPCGLEIASGPTENVFSRADRVLFTLHDFGADGWALVLPDGRYLSDHASPAGLAFFEADGRLCSPERVLALHQPEGVRATLAHDSTRPAQCAF